MAEAYLRSLGLPGVQVISSGTVAERDRGYNTDNFAASRAVLAAHHLDQFAKERPEQLTADLLRAGDLTICMNQRVWDEAADIGPLPANSVVWGVMDLGEQEKPLFREQDQHAYRENTLKRITELVDELASELTRNT